MNEIDNTTTELEDRPLGNWRRDEEARRFHRGPPVSRDTLVRIAAELAERHPEIQAVYLFGSRAAGVERATSDIDLAILLPTVPDIMDRIALQEEMQIYVEDSLEVPTDVIVLHPDLRPALLFEIFVVETILFARDREAAHEYACRARQEYRDLLPRLERAFDHAAASIRAFSPTNHQS